MNYQTMPLFELVNNSLSVLLTFANAAEKQMVFVAACRVQDEITKTDVRVEDRPIYERFLMLMGLSLTMLPWLRKVETFVKVEP